MDTRRTVKDTGDQILRSLEKLELLWDEEVVYQSHRSRLYRDALASLAEIRATFDCACTRKELDGALYPGTCRNGVPTGKQAHSVRVLVDTDVVGFNDAVQGLFEQDLTRDVGDFVVRRGDGQTAYHLATVIDDAAQGITEIVRGSDLLDSTPRQILLQRLLKVPTPQYAHLPVATNRAGQKLSKQTHAGALRDKRFTEQVFRSLDFLGQAPPKELLDETLDSLWSWAIAHWSLKRVPVKMQLPDSNSS